MLKKAINFNLNPSITLAPETIQFISKALAIDPK
jgi:hypothetical protein